MDGYMDCVTDENGKVRHYTCVCAHPQMEGSIEDLYNFYSYKFENHPDCRLLATFSIHTDQDDDKSDCDLHFTNILIMTQNYRENLRRYVNKGFVKKEVYEEIYDRYFEAL